MEKKFKGSVAAQSINELQHDETIIPTNTKQDRTHSPWKCTSEDIGTAGDQHFWLLVFASPQRVVSIPRCRSSIGHGKFSGAGMGGNKHQLWQIPFWLMSRWAGRVVMSEKTPMNTSSCDQFSLLSSKLGWRPCWPRDGQTNTNLSCVSCLVATAVLWSCLDSQTPAAKKKPKNIWSKAPNSWSVRAEVSPSRDFIQRLVPLLLRYTTSRKVRMSQYLLLERWTRLKKKVKKEKACVVVPPSGFYLFFNTASWHHM